LFHLIFIDLQNVGVISAAPCTSTECAQFCAQSCSLTTGVFSVLLQALFLHLSMTIFLRSLYVCDLTY